MKNLSILALAAAMTVGVSARIDAQTAEVKTKTTTRIELDGGKDVTVTGCVSRAADGLAFMLTNVGTTTGALKTYHLVVDDGDDSEARELARYLGQKVEIKGKASDEGKATVKTSTKTEVERPGPDRETETRGELKGNLHGVAFLGVDSVKPIATACP